MNAPSGFRELPVATRADLARVYRNLGGTPLEREAKLAAILNALYERLAADTMLGFFFAAKDLRTIAMHQKQFLMRAMGASPSYPGKAPAQAHLALAPILPGHFDRRALLLSQVLEEHGLSEEDRHSWLGFENSFRQAILRQDPESTPAREPDRS
jgi:truncated hemoglobin YjbI